MKTQNVTLILIDFREAGRDHEKIVGYFKRINRQSGSLLRASFRSTTAEQRSVHAMERLRRRRRQRSL